MKPALLGVLLAIQSVGITWLHFRSSTYPYTMAQPSSFRHVVLKDAMQRPVDYFFPSLGSTTTNVNVYAVARLGAPYARSYLHMLGGKHIHNSGMVVIMGKKRHVVIAQFHGLAGKWTVEEVTIAVGSRMWYLTASYVWRYHKLRPIMMRMLHSFSPHA